MSLPRAVTVAWLSERGVEEEEEEGSHYDGSDDEGELFHPCFTREYTR